jgi:hypothetical protein
MSTGRALSAEEVLAIYNNGNPLNHGETWEYTGEPEQHPLTKRSFRDAIKIGHTELECIACNVIECLSEADVSIATFHGQVCTYCGEHSLRIVEKQTELDFLMSYGFCKYGRSIGVYLTVCESCRDYVKGMTMGAFRPFRERKS